MSLILKVGVAVGVATRSGVCWRHFEPVAVTLEHPREGKRGITALLDTMEYTQNIYTKLSQLHLDF